MAEFTLLAATPSSATIHVVWVVIWFVLVTTATATLVGLVLTRWGRSQPLRICVVLSLIAHLLLAGYAATIRIAGTTTGTADQVIEVALGDALFGAIEPARQVRPWEQFPGQPAEIPPLEAPRMSESVVPETDLLPRATKTSEQTTPLAALASQVTPGQLEAAPAPPARSPVAKKPTSRLPRLEIAGPKRVTENRRAEDPGQDSDELKQAAKQTAPSPERRETTSLQPGGMITATPLATPPAISAEKTDAPANGSKAIAEDKPANRPQLVKIQRPPGGEGAESAEAPGGHRIPELYRLRTAVDRTRQSGRFGGSRETEAAVEAGLRWLAAAQGSDGSWEAVRWQGGRERAVTDHHRRRAGAQAQTGITALALLAFLGRGHTHMSEGSYQETVQQGLEYLAAHQRRSGNLAGEATLFASMYCHGMATFALSEAYGMTGDARIRPFLERAIAYTVACQNKQTGGWRYRPGDTGDTSQHGWQVMALKSAELAGIPISASAKQGITRFLSYVSSGTHGGLACYRPGRPPSRAMTAEALVCHLFSGSSPHGPLADEAAAYLLEQPPEASHGTAKPMNLYSWYYATMALYHRQDAMWDDWNRALQDALLATQNRRGSLAGSWDPDTEWGSYGGRVYSTAMATLCLEVYYRFLPLYGGATAGGTSAQKAETSPR